MKTKPCIAFFILFLAIGLLGCMDRFVPNTAPGQGEVVKRVSNRVPIKNLVVVEVEASTDHVIFYGVNNSFIPHQLDLEFSELSNLKPQTKLYKMMIEHGRTRLFDLQVQQRNVSPTYSYKFRYYRGDPTSTPDTDFQYLIPAARNKKITVVDLPPAVKGPVLLKLSAGDTLYAMRKGRVTATTENSNKVDRVTPSSLEVYHQDGTLASYHASQCKSLVQEGDLVYPGQPIGLLLQAGTVNACVYRFSPNGGMGPIAVNYTVDGTTLLMPDHLNGVIVAHPPDVIRKELTKSELTKWQQGKLYK